MFIMIRHMSSKMLRKEISSLFRGWRSSIQGNRGLYCSSRNSKTFEPDYLDAIDPEAVLYPPMNIQAKSYDFHTLEHFQRLIKSLSLKMDLEVSECWASPGRDLQIDTFALGGTEVKDSYFLTLYERTVQIKNLKSTEAPVLLDMIKVATPSGIQVLFHEHTEDQSEARLVPDPFINGLKGELDQIDGKRDSEMEKAAVKKATKAATAKVAAPLLI